MANAALARSPNGAGGTFVVAGGSVVVDPPLPLPGVVATGVGVGVGALDPSPPQEESTTRAGAVSAIVMEFETGMPPSCQSTQDSMLRSSVDGHDGRLMISR